MSGTTVTLGYVPDGTVLVPPNSPVTVMTGSDAAVDAAVAGAIAALSRVYSVTDNGSTLTLTASGGSSITDNGSTLTLA